MLVLSRHIGESIQIGEDITVKVIRLSNGTVKLGFDAPKDKKIVRTEVLERLSANQSQHLEEMQ